MNPKIERILVGVDSSTNARDALEWAVLLAERFDAEIIAVHAVGLLADLGQQSQVPSRSHLGELRRLFESKWCAPLLAFRGLQRSLLEDGSPVQVLLRVADREQVDAIVVGSRGEGGFTELLLGSTSLQLVEHSSRPVLVVPSSAGHPVPGGKE